MVGKPSKNTALALNLLLIVVGMCLLTAASVPLYRLFCQVTGYGGTTQIATAPSTKISDKTLIMRFDANVSGDLPGWKFQPKQRTIDVRYGENKIAVYLATNTTDKPMTGTASFNVTPEVAGVYFNKIECFCFTEQTLQPGESVEMPVSFYVDPEMLKDSDAGHLSQLTLSYTFHRVNETAGDQSEQTNSSDKRAEIRAPSSAGESRNGT